MRCKSILLCLTLLVGCNLDLDPKQDWQALSVADYVELTSNDEACRLVRPDKASSIDFGWNSQKDGHDYWWCLKDLGESDYEQFANEFGEQVSKLDFTDYADGFTKTGTPSRWSTGLLGNHWPKWWKIEGDSLICKAWEKEVVRGPSPRSLGWVVVYEVEEQRVCIWHFDKQHSWLCNRDIDKVWDGQEYGRRTGRSSITD